MSVRSPSAKLAVAQSIHHLLTNAQRAPSWGSPVPDPCVSPGARILLVEDDETLALLMTYNLQAKGYAVSWLSRGDAVEPFLEKEAVDLLILDWKLPGRSGLDICRCLRGRPAARNLPIIMVTALGEEGDRMTGLSAGADDYFAKPFSMTELLARVDALLGPPA